MASKVNLTTRLTPLTDFIVAMLFLALLLLHLLHLEVLLFGV